MLLYKSGSWELELFQNLQFERIIILYECRDLEGLCEYGNSCQMNELFLFAILYL